MSAKDVFLDRLSGNAWGVVHYFNETGHFYSQEASSEEDYFELFRQADCWIEEATTEGRKGLDAIGERYSEDNPRPDKMKKLTKEALNGGYQP